MCVLWVFTLFSPCVLHYGHCYYFQQIHSHIPTSNHINAHTKLSIPLSFFCVLFFPCLFSPCLPLSPLADSIWGVADIRQPLLSLYAKTDISNFTHLLYIHIFHTEVPWLTPCLDSLKLIFFYCDTTFFLFVSSLLTSSRFFCHSYLLLPILGSLGPEAYPSWPQKGFHTGQVISSSQAWHLETDPHIQNQICSHSHLWAVF